MLVKMENGTSTPVTQQALGCYPVSSRIIPQAMGSQRKIFGMETCLDQEFRKHSVEHGMDDRMETVRPSRKLFLKISMVYALQANSVSY